MCIRLVCVFTYAAKFFDPPVDFAGNMVFLNVQVEAKVDQRTWPFDEFQLSCGRRMDHDQIGE